MYGDIVRRDHRLFFEAFRNERIPILDMHQTLVEHYPGPPLS